MRAGWQAPLHRGPCWHSLRGMTDPQTISFRSAVLGRLSPATCAKTALIALALLSTSAMGQGAPVPAAASASAPAAAEPQSYPAPSEIVAAAPASDWVAIPASDLLVMTLTPDARGHARRVVIQLMPAPFSQGWVANIRTLAAAHWWDGLAVTRVQDNYVAQWGDPDGEDPAKARSLPQGLRVMGEAEYSLKAEGELVARNLEPTVITPEDARADCRNRYPDDWEGRATCEYESQQPAAQNSGRPDAYAPGNLFYAGWPFALGLDETAWPVHCYGMVGVGRGMSPDTGSGAELYTVIGHAPRHLDRNIAVVGRVVEGIEHLSSLPRGTGPLGFYETPEERTAITSIRLASDLPAAEQPRMEYLSTESDSFARYADARANRRDPFFITPAGGADICNIPVPVRRVRAGG